MVDEDYECPRCDGDGVEESTSELNLRLFSLTWTSEKQCEHCHGSGRITETREARFDELSDRQIKLLTKAEIYRETGGEEAQQQAQRGSKQMTRGSAGTPHTGPHAR